MLISEEYFNKLDPRYKKLIQELGNNLNASNDYITKTNYISSFSKKFLMPKEYWQVLSNFAYYLTEDSYYHFYYEKTIGCKKNENEVYLKLLEFRHENLKYSFPETLVLLKSDISYPHSKITKRFERFEELSYSLPSTKTWNKYKRMKNLFVKIKAAENNSKQWFYCLLEVEDNEFICHNIEYRLGSNLLDNDLWKLYIEYLSKRNPSEMLQVYSKYCRFFISNFGMKEKYRNHVEKFGPVKVLWDYPFDFELKTDKTEPNNTQNNEGEILQPQNQLSERDADSTVDLKNHVKDFFQSCKRQDFSFANPLILYILDNANHLILRKLYQTCKYFYAKKEVPICYRLEMSPHVIPNDAVQNFKYKKETFQSALNFAGYGMLNKLYVTTVLQSFNYGYNNSRLLSNIITRLYRCDAKYISITDQHLYFDELQFLVGHGNVIKMDFQNVKIENTENQPVNLEDIMILLPNIKILQLFNFIKSTTNTSTILLNQNFNKKFDFIKIAFSYGEFFDFFDFWHFIKKNGHQNLTLGIFFNEHFDAEMVEKFSKIISNCQLLTAQTFKDICIGHGEYYPSELD